jgi:hypothetical protein
VRKKKVNKLIAIGFKQRENGIVVKTTYCMAV